MSVFMLAVDGFHAAVRLLVCRLLALSGSLSHA